MFQMRSFMVRGPTYEIQAHEDNSAANVTRKFEDNDLEDTLKRHQNLQTDIFERSNKIFLNLSLLGDHIVERTAVKQIRKAVQESWELSTERKNLASSKL
ncbi:Ankyrin repeat, PH and SEC7 domain containing protein secG [Paramyrothecium foliicola]|nr:Ankyrin repeat, PH and SEC7 domain containing protein secG [Paramyrothecium foliicola]